MDSSGLNVAEMGPVSSSKDTEAILLELQREGSLSALFPLPRRSANQTGGALQPAGLAKRAAQLRLTRHPTVGNEPWFAQAFRSRWELYRAWLDEYRKQPSAESVHEMRVSSRRLASQLMLLGCVVGGRKPCKVQRMLKSQLRSLGAVRDLHVQRIFLEQQATKFPQVALLREHLMRRERELIKPASRRMSNSKVKKLQRWIDRLEEEFAQVASDVVKQEEFAAAAWRCAEDAFAETVRCWRLIRLSDLRTIHHTRVAFKRKMGNIQDLVVIQKCIADFIDENGTREAPLRPFCAYVRRRGGRALRAFRDSAEKLFQFWPLPGPDAASPSRSIHYAA